jgi:hypothetical protein
VRIPHLSDEVPPVSLVVGLGNIRHQRLSLERALTRILPLPHNLAAPESCDAIANVRCYEYPAKEVLVRVLGSLLAWLGIRLVWAAVEFVAKWSLDTVNTNPLMQTTRACE